MNSVDGVFAQSVGDFAVVGGDPWSVVIGRRIPSVAPEEIVAAADIEEVVGHSHRNVKSELRRRYKFRRCRDYYGRGGIHRRHGSADIDTYVETDIGRIGLGCSDQKSSSRTEQILFHTVLLSGLFSVFTRS